MGTLRTLKTEHAYRNKLQERQFEDGCPLCREVTILEFTHWRVISNAYPYDRIASVHNMLLPKRHVTEEEITEEEWDELFKIKKEYINGLYEFTLELTLKEQSLPMHYHLHLIILSAEYSN